MKSHRPKYLSDYSSSLQRKILYKNPSFLIDVKFKDISKQPVSQKIQVGAFDPVAEPIKPSPIIFKIIADKIKNPSHVSIINRYITNLNITFDKLKTFIDSIDNIQFNNSNNLDAHLRVLITDHKTVINIDGNDETNTIIKNVISDADIKSIDMYKFIDMMPTADLYILNKCIHKYPNDIMNKLSKLKGHIFVCDYDTNNTKESWFINFTDKYNYTTKIDTIKLFDSIPIGESRVLINNLYNEYAIMFLIQ